MAATAFYATASFTPAAAAYSAGDVISVAKTLTWTTIQGEAFAGGILVLLGSTLLAAVNALQSGEGAYRAALYNAAPPSGHADNDAWDIPSGDRVAFQRLLELGTPVDLGSSLHVAVDGMNVPLLVPPGGVTYMELVTVAGFTATAAARTVQFLAIRP